MWQILERQLMNIQRIYSTKIYNNPFVNKNENQTNYMLAGLKIAQPLETDTVSFQGRSTKLVSKELRSALARKEARAIRDAKLIAESKIAPEKSAPTKKNLSGDERKWGVSKSTAKQIRGMILEPQKQIHDFMDRVFSDLKVSELSPKNILLDYSDRAKSVISIMEKSSTREWNSIKEVLNNMTDLNGGKLVLNFKTGKVDAENALDRLIPMIKTKQVTLHEIELQRPEDISKLSPKEQEEYDYVSKVFLDKLEDAQEEVMNGLETDIDKIKLINRPLPKYTKANYCALHLILQLNEKGSRPFELQIMGAREAKGKALDDKGFKFFEGKELDKKYNPLIALWKPLRSEENKATKEEYFRYRKNANLQLRKDEIQEHITQRLINRPTGLFKTVREYNLIPDYDLNRLYKIMIKCETEEAEKELPSSSSKTIFKRIIQKLGYNSEEKIAKN